MLVNSADFSMLKIIDKIRQSACDQAVKNVAEEVHFFVVGNRQVGKVMIKTSFGNCVETIVHKIYLDAFDINKN